MKNTEFPLKKTFRKPFLDEAGKLIFTLVYSQSTMQEYHEFFFLSPEERMIQIYLEVKKQIPVTLFERFMRLIFGDTFKGKIERSIDMDQVCADILANRFKTYHSIYDDAQEAQQQVGNEGKKSLFSANLSIICQKYCIDPLTLFERFTLEQFMWLQDGVIFNLNESDTTGKGQFENQKALVDKEAVKKRAEENRRAFEEMEKNNIQ